jgi:hypothetical protein
VICKLTAVNLSPVALSLPRFCWMWHLPVLFFYLLYFSCTAQKIQREIFHFFLKNDSSEKALPKRRQETQNEKLS